MAFYVGQKVVCVDAKPRHYPNSLLIEGEVYTIAGYAKNSLDEAVFIFEKEATYPASGFYADRFRPVVEKKTDISIFEAMLNMQPSKLDEQV